MGEREGLLIPTLHESDTIETSNVRWILVIEKEATFRSLACSAFWTDIGSQGIILTAKGYPDLSTRLFLREILSASFYIPIYAIVDFDPDGLAILSTYKHGSYSLAHENSASKSDTEETRSLNIPQLKWLGPKSSHLHANLTQDSCDNEAARPAQGLMKLTPRDRQKARKMLEWEVLAETGLEPEWRRELQTMMMLNVKAEMQIFEERKGGLGLWLRRELGLGMEDLRSN